MKSVVVVTGGAGFIGSNFVGKLLELGFKVVVVDNLTTGKLDNLRDYRKNGNFLFKKCDVNNRKELFSIVTGKVKYIFHYAACVGVRRTLDNPMTVLLDIEGFKNILDLAVEKKIKRLFFSSSSEVYGETVSFPQNEESTPLNSRLPYAVVKNVGEVFIKAYQKKFGLDYTIFRFFNTYGPRQSEDFVISKFIRQALKGEEITIYGKGKQTRPFLYVDDNVEITTKAIFEKGVINKVVNVGSDVEITVRELAARIIKLTGLKVGLKFLPALTEGDMPRRLPDISLMREKLKISPKIDLNDGLKKTIAYLAKGVVKL